MAVRCTITGFLPSFSRPNLGQMRVSNSPMKKITIGSAESEAAEARATAGAVINPMR